MESLFKCVIMSPFGGGYSFLGVSATLLLLSWFPSTILLLEGVEAQQSPLHPTTSPFTLVNVVLEGQQTKRNFQFGALLQKVLNLYQLASFNASNAERERERTNLGKWPNTRLLYLQASPWEVMQLIGWHTVHPNPCRNLGMRPCKIQIKRRRTTTQLAFCPKEVNTLHVFYPTF